MAFNDMLRQKILEEIDFALAGMRDPENDVFKQLYYMSGIHGALSRAFNLDYDKSLVFAHFVFNTCYQSFNAQINKIAGGGEKIIELDVGIVSRLADLVSEFRERFENGNEYYDILEQVAELTFSITGNGYYLHKRGIL